MLLVVFLLSGCQDQFHLERVEGGGRRGILCEQEFGVRVSFASGEVQREGGA